MFLDILSQFFALCPCLSDRKIHQNYLSAEFDAASLTLTGEKPILRRYTDGSALYQTVFKLVLREPFDPSYDFSSFYSSFSDWVSGVNASKAFPSLPKEYTPVSLSVLNGGSIKSSSPSFSEYEILCRFVYYK